MSSTQIRKSDSLIWRLSFYHTAVVAAAISGAFFLAYLFYSSIVYQGIDEFLAAEVPEFKNILRLHGIDELAKEIRDEANEIGRSRIYFKLHLRNGTTLAESDLSVWKSLPLQNASFDSNLSKATYNTIALTSRNLRARVMYVPLSSDVILEAGQILTYEDSHLNSLAIILSILAFLATVFSLLTGYLMLSRMIRRMNQVARTASLIATGTTTARVPASHKHDEINYLALTFNAMLDRIDSLISSLKQVIENLSHELKTPLTRLRIEAEMLTRGKNLEGPFSEFTLDVMSETDRAWH